MAGNDRSSPGLFNKMVKFVRGAGMQWNDLDEASSQKEGSLSNQALKEMIERKRRNDFVRKREFDMLRKLRRRETTGGAMGDASVRPSFFQSSMPSRPDDRAMTLKKIDEIEAQMSMQWWKAKHSSISTVGSDYPASEPGVQAGMAGASGTPVPAPAPKQAYARTVPDRLRGGVGQSAAKFGLPMTSAASTAYSNRDPAAMSGKPPTTQGDLPDGIFNRVSGTLPANTPLDEIDTLDFTSPKPPGKPNQSVSQPDPEREFKLESAPARPAISLARPPDDQRGASRPELSAAPLKSRSASPKPGLMGGLAASMDASGAASGFSASKIFALEVDEVQHDPELEEAAIRFANGDDAGAENGLLEAIAHGGARHQHEETWLTLFDLYRATGNVSRFDNLAIDFASKFGRSAPTWFSIPEMVGKIVGSELAAPASNRKYDWKCPSVMGIQTLAALNAALAKSQMPWSLDWGSLQTIEEAALAPFIKILHSWAQQPVQLRFGGTSNLEEVLKKATPSGDKSVHQDRWNLLMAYLRVAHRPDEFELAALDFCVTYEVSPPSWEPARCEFKKLDADGNTGVGQTIVSEAVHDSIVSEYHGETGSPASQIMAQLASVELSGQIMGEPKPVLDKLEARLQGADVLVISCAKLIRVDFSAAGSLLNWVASRQAEGRLVQFTDVHRLVAAFFHVIGISEHGKVVTRKD